jgi:hypothetical protein
VSFPDDVTVREIRYDFGADNGVTFSLSVGAETGPVRAAAEELAPYLEAALIAFRTAYENGTPNSAIYLQRTYNGSREASL